MSSSCPLAELWPDYLAADRKLMAVPMQGAGSTFRVGAATALFSYYPDSSEL
jgi:hypothetical protein